MSKSVCHIFYCAVSVAVVINPLMNISLKDAPMCDLRKFYLTL